MVRFEQAVSDGDDKPAKAMEEMKGYYRSCVYKWRKTRRQDSWTIICAASPRLAKKFRELPDCIRSFLGKSRKFPNRASAVDESSTCILPVPFQDLVAAMIVERIDVGEEVDFHYVSSLLEVAIEQWNECVGILKKELESPEAILKEIDAGEATSERDWEAGIEKIRAQTQMLRTISLSKSDGAPGEFLLLGIVFMCFASFALGSQFATLRVLLFACFCILYIYTYKCQNPLAEIGGNAAHMLAFQQESCGTLVQKDFNSHGEQLETRAPFTIFTPRYGGCAGLGELPGRNPQGTRFAPGKL